MRLEGNILSFIKVIQSRIVIPEEKIQQIKKHLRRGEPEGELKERLIREGHNEEDLKLIFKPHQYDMRGWYLIFAILILVAGLYQLLNNGGILLLILGFLLFGAWYLEGKRLENLSSKKNEGNKSPTDLDKENNITG